MKDRMISTAKYGVSSAGAAAALVVLINYAHAIPSDVQGAIQFLLTIAINFALVQSGLFREE